MNPSNLLPPSGFEEYPALDDLHDKHIYFAEVFSDTVWETFEEWAVNGGSQIKAAVDVQVEEDLKQGIFSTVKEAVSNSMFIAPYLAAYIETLNEDLLFQKVLESVSEEEIEIFQQFLNSMGRSLITVGVAHNQFLERSAKDRKLRVTDLCADFISQEQKLLFKPFIFEDGSLAWVDNFSYKTRALIMLACRMGVTAYQTARLYGGVKKTDHQVPLKAFLDSTYANILKGFPPNTLVHGPRTPDMRGYREIGDEEALVSDLVAPTKRSVKAHDKFVRDLHGGRITPKK